MATVTVAHNPELTAEGAMEVFRGHFVGRYDIYKPGGLYGRALSFVVKKSAWTGAGVKLKQQQNATTFVLVDWMPSFRSFLLMLLLGFAGLIPFLLTYVFLHRPSSKAMEKEVRAFIENAREFK